LRHTTHSFWCCARDARGAHVCVHTHAWGAGVHATEVARCRTAAEARVPAHSPTAMARGSCACGCAGCRCRAGVSPPGGHGDAPALLAVAASACACIDTRVTPPCARTHSWRQLTLPRAGGAVTTAQHPVASMCDSCACDCQGRHSE
jgi:hypothetical protein